MTFTIQIIRAVNMWRKNTFCETSISFFLLNRSKSTRCDRSHSSKKTSCFVRDNIFSFDLGVETKKKYLYT